MKKTILALTILVSFGVVGCSSSGSSSDLVAAGMSTVATQSEKKQIDNSESESASRYTSILTLAESVTDTTERGSGSHSEFEENPVIEDTTETQNMVSANAFAPSYFANNSASYSHRYLNDIENAQMLLSQVGTIDTLSGTAATGVTVEEGTILLVKNNPSYSGYAVIREAYPETRDNDPVNSYVAVVKSPTSETVDKSVFVDATYKGSATYTSKNTNTVTGYTAKNGDNVGVTLNVKDSVVSGSVARLTGTQQTLVTFNNADIQTSEAGVTFQGEALFHSSAGGVLSYKDENGSYADVSGRYQGQFAGEKAKEVVGIFETNGTTKEVSAQGAFIATCALGSCQ